MPCRHGEFGEFLDWREPARVQNLVMVTACSLTACSLLTSPALGCEDAVPSRYGVAVAAGRDTVVVAGEMSDPEGNRSGALYFYARRGDSWTEVDRVLANDALVEDLFTSVDIDGDTAILAAQYSDARGEDAGAAYVFERRNARWTMASQLTASDGRAGDQFGLTSSVSGDLIAVGARLANARGRWSGKGYVFERRGEVWEALQTIYSSDLDGHDLFGRAAIDGDILVMSADFDDDKGENSGAAYVFERRREGFVEVAKLTAHDGAEGDELGITLAVHAGTIVLGAIGQDAQGSSSGAAYVFERRDETWQETAKLVASDGAPGDNLGWSVAIDGDRIVVGAPGRDGQLEDSGAAYVFERRGGGWVETAKLTPAEETREGLFGHSVGVYADTIVVGLFGVVSEEALGAAYIFESDDDSWREVTKLTPED